MTNNLLRFVTPRNYNSRPPKLHPIKLKEDIDVTADEHLKFMYVVMRIQY